MSAENTKLAAGTEHVVLLRDEYERVLPEIKAVPDTALLPINIDVQQAVTTALGAWPAISSFRAEIQVQTPQLDMARFDMYLTYAHALAYAQARFMTASTPSGHLPPLAQKAVVLRNLILTDATALANRELINSERLKELNGPVGYSNVAFDLVALAALVRESWDNVVGKTAITLQELDEADQLGSTLVSEVGLRDQAPATVAETGDIRQKAFTVFVSLYDQIRRALTFIRWNEGDVDEIAPSLYAKHASAKAKGGSDVHPAPAANGSADKQATAANPVATDGDTLPTGAVPAGHPGSPALLGK